MAPSAVESFWCSCMQESSIRPWMLPSFMHRSYPATHQKARFFRTGCERGHNTCQEVLSLCVPGEIVGLLLLAVSEKYHSEQGYYSADS